MKITLFILFALCFSESYSQSEKVYISGYIKDSDSGETLPGATVFTDRNDGTSANSYGYYSILVNKGVSLLKFNYIGYSQKDMSIDIKCDTVINVYLSASAHSIEQIIIKTDPLPIVKIENMGNVSVNMKQLKFSPLFLGEQDVFKYLHMLPGVSAGKEGSSGLNIRGGSSDQSLILLDDVPIYNQTHAFGFVSIFTGEAIKSAELYKTYTSPIYGGRLSAIASFRMKDGNKFKHHKSILIGTVTASLSLEGPIKKGKGSYMVSARRFIPDLFLRGVYAITNSDNTTRPMFSFYDISIKSNYDLNNKNSIYFSLYSGQDKLSVTSKETGNRNYGYEETATDYIKTKSKGGFGWGNAIASIRLNSLLSTNVFMNNTIYFSHLKNFKKTNYKDYGNKIRSDSKVESLMKELGVRTNFDHKLNTNYTLSYGFNASLQFFEPQITSYKRDNKIVKKNYGNRRLSSLAFFANNDFYISKFNINTGLRFSVYNNQVITVYVIEPRLSASVALNNNISCWIAYARNTQPLFSMDKYYYAMPIDYWMPFTNKNIPVSDQFSVGSKKSFNPYFNVYFEVYYKKMKNLSLVYDSDDFLLGEGGYDIAKGTAYGIETMFQYQKNKWGITVSYSWSKSERKVNNNSFPFMYDIPYNLNIFCIYDIFNRTNRKHTFSININYKTGLPYILSNESYPALIKGSESGGVNHMPRYPNIRLNNFFRTDISYNMERVKKNGIRNWQISILNLTNHKNPYVVYKDKTKYKSMTLIPFMPSFSYKRTF